MRLFSVVLIALTLVLSSNVNAQRIKDLASIQGVRSNQLVSKNTDGEPASAWCTSFELTSSPSD